MDPVTHAVLGATVAMALAPSQYRRAAALAGLSAGLLPDADILIGSADDPLLAVEYHRHFTHAWAFQPVIALLAAGIALALLRVFRRKTPFRALYLPALGAALSHPFCDAWTSYGTRLYWPFSEARVGWDWVSVIDPLITLPLLAALAFGLLFPRRRILPLLGCAAVAAYLSTAVFQRERARSAIETHLADRETGRLRVKPSFANIMVWRCLWEEDGHIACASVRAGLRVTVHPGERAAQVHVEQLLHPEGPIPENSVHHRDLRRFAHFSDDWLVWHPERNSVLCDARYATLPHVIAPLWGIGLTLEDPGRHVSWETFREADREQARKLWRAIWGKIP